MRSLQFIIEGKIPTIFFDLMKNKKLKEEIIKLLEEMAIWPEPKPGAGEGLGPLAGTGMYLQYDVDRKKHKEQILKIIEYLKQK